VNYEFQKIEEKWQKKWKETNLYKTNTNSSSPKFYYLDMFPYPSGDLHMGHVRNYIIGDVIARYKTMQGFNVLHPMGWDAFGLPAENAAIERNIHPEEWTLNCIKKMKEQFNKLGISFNWEREVTTCLPDYYKWTQWFFVQFFKQGLAYKKKSAVNFCPHCKTVLANEQVVAGLCERCDTAVIKKDLEQWFFKITDYAERLLADLELLEGWPERVRTMQKNWIGKSEGAIIKFKIPNSKFQIEDLPVFTTRPDTVFGVTFVVIAPEHPLIEKLIADDPNQKEILKFIEKTRLQSEIERTSTELKKEGILLQQKVLNPVTKEEVALFIGNYVVMEYGTGAVMGVPAHDQRDFEFAKKYNLPIKVVVNPVGEKLNPATLQQAYEGDGLQTNSGKFNHLPTQAAKKEIVKFLTKENIGYPKINYRLRDWCISRQRYWGAPIPIIYCDDCGMVPVPENDLPVLLPKNVDFRAPTERGAADGLSPLARNPEFVNTICPKCHKKAQRETDTMDTFVCSSWYYFRYTSPRENNSPFTEKDVHYWLPVDQYVGGIEHAVLHLLYSRFFTKVLQDMGLVKFSEPFKKLFTQGMVIKDGFKMSKSKGNVVTPDEINSTYGADTARLFILFVGPPENDVEWSDKGVEGAFRFILKIFKQITNYANDLKLFGPLEKEDLSLNNLQPAEIKLLRKLNQTIKKVKEDIEERFHFHTAIASIMELVNLWVQFNPRTDLTVELSRRRKCFAVWYQCTEKLLLMLAPFIPHVTEELWEIIGKRYSIHLQSFPDYDKDFIPEEEITIGVQVNGKLRTALTLPLNCENELALTKVKEIPKIKNILQDKELLKFIYVPNKIINLIVK